MEPTFSGSAKPDSTPAISQKPLAVLPSSATSMRGVVVSCRINLPFRRWTARMIGHDAVVVSVYAYVGVLRVNPWRPSGHPKSLDLFILEDIVQMHISAEDILHSSAIISLGRIVSQSNRWYTESPYPPVGQAVRPRQYELQAL